MKIFFRRILLFLSPVLIALSVVLWLYIKKDAYLDFGRYGNYSWKYNFQVLGDIDTKKLLKSDYPYNSFVFGSSRSVSLYACYLQSRLPDSRFFHYASWNETVGGIQAKMKLLDSLGYTIRNVFFYFDTDFTFAGNGECNPLDHYLLTKENKLSYYYQHFRNMILPDNLNMWKIMVGYPVSAEIFVNWESDTTTNDHQHICNSEVLQEYSNRELSDDQKHNIAILKENGILYERHNAGICLEPQISRSEYIMLQDIKRILEKHHTRYGIVITPLYDQMKFNKADLAILNGIFKGHIYDYSGINEFTSDENNYPDGKHFLPYISMKMADSVLSDNKIW